MKRVANILDNDKNKGIDFIVHVKNEEQLNDLISVLIERQFEIQPPIIEETLADWMRSVAKEEGYDTCFRIRNREDNRCVAYNPSIEHWRLFCNDILEIINNELEFNEGEYSIEDAKIEAKKLYREFTEDKTILKLFDYDVNLSNDEIVYDMTTASNLHMLSLVRNCVEERLSTKSNIPFRVELFSLHKINGTDGYCKKIHKENGEYDIEFKCLDNYMMPFVLRHFLGEEITESDKVFYHEGLLSKFIETPKIEVNLNETIKN